MQPYFFPYSGYFRLMAAAETFILLDCVQFPRRGWVHRNRMPNAVGEEKWLTLPLAKQPRGILIRELAFCKDARGIFDARLRSFPWIASASGSVAEDVREFLYAPLPAASSFISDSVMLSARMLGLAPRILRSSDLNISPSLTGQERIIALVSSVGATGYINSPGGRLLYDSATFARAGLTLRFLSPFQGPSQSMLYRLLSEGTAALRREIEAETSIIE